MEPLHILLAGDPNTTTGSYVYLRRMVEGLERANRTVVQHVLPTLAPSPDENHFDAVDHVLSAVPDGALTLVDGSALGYIPSVVQRHQTRLHLIGLVHHPLARETGLSGTEARHLFETERDALATVRQVVVSSAHTARTLAEYGVDSDRMAIVVPGTDSAPLAVGSNSEHGFAMLCVGSYTPRKGYPILFEALSELGDREWTLLCIGSTTYDPAHADAIHSLALSHPYTDRITIKGEKPFAELAPYFHRSDIFVLASYYEGYGMVLAEAVARGLPIVSTTGGAIADTVPDGAGILVPPGDANALSGALARVMDDAALLDSLRESSMAARASLPTWNEAVTAFEAAIWQRGV